MRTYVWKSFSIWDNAHNCIGAFRAPVITSRVIQNRHLSPIVARKPTREAACLHTRLPLCVLASDFFVICCLGSVLSFFSCPPVIFCMALYSEEGKFYRDQRSESTRYGKCHGSIANWYSLHWQWRNTMPEWLRIMEKNSFSLVIYLNAPKGRRIGANLFGFFQIKKNYGISALSLFSCEGNAGRMNRNNGLFMLF